MHMVSPDFLFPFSFSLPFSSPFLSFPFLPSFSPPPSSFFSSLPLFPSPSPPPFIYLSISLFSSVSSFHFAFLMCLLCTHTFPFVISLLHTSLPFFIPLFFFFFFFICCDIDFSPQFQFLFPCLFLFSSPFPSAVPLSLFPFVSFCFLHHGFLSPFFTLLRSVTFPFLICIRSHPSLVT